MPSKRKRLALSKQASTPSAKRAKLEKPSSSKPKSIPHNLLSHTVPVDQLEWKAVEVSDKLADYEVFFGLEEVEGVEVVKDSVGRITFRTTTSTTPLDASLNTAPATSSQEES